MVEYVYMCQVFFNPKNVVGVNEAQELLDAADFEDNYKADTIPISEFAMLNNSFEITKSYADFKDLITGGIEWTDVKCLTNHKCYCLYLITTNPL